VGLRGKGMLMTFTEVPPEHEEDFNEWYNREHLDERVAMPGFRRARRYAAFRADPKYFATYETKTVADLAAPGYLKLLADQSPWSKRVMKRFSKFHRLTLRISVDLAHGVGGGVAVCRFFPAPEGMRPLRAWLKETALPEAIRRPGMLGAFLGENDLDVANAPARAQGVGFPQASQQEWAVLFEAADARTALAAARETLTALKPRGVARTPIFGAYSLQFGNER
jgi:hypothetical protein